MNSYKKTYLRFFVLFCLSSVFGYAQVIVPHTLYQQFNGPFDYTIIGNSHNAFDNWSSPSPPCVMLTSSSATLNLASNQTIVGAYLIWAGIGDGSNTAISLNGNILQPDYINILDAHPSSFSAPWNYFSAVKNVTSLVQSAGNGLYQVSNFDLNPINGQYCSTAVYYSGWNIVIVYSNPTLPNKQLNIYDGYQFVGATLTPRNFTISNLNITSTANAKLTYILFNGSPNTFINESVEVNGNTMSNAQNPPNNPFNGTNSFTGSSTSWNMDVDTYLINNYINVGNTSLQITLNSQLNRNISTIITSIQSSLPDATISLDSISGQDICQNRDLALDYTVYNLNSSDTLLAGTPISVFVNDSILISTGLLPSNILIGDSLSLSTLVTIPNGISSPFSLSMVVNQNSTQLGVYSESNFLNNTSNDSIISLIDSPTSNPVFNLPSNICQSENFVLPQVDTNGVSGSWTPAFNNQQTTNYTFVPNATACATNYNYTLVVNPTHVSFDTVAICQNQLPLLWNGQTLTSATNTSVTYQNQYGCDSLLNLHLIVNPNPVFDFSIPAWSGCLPLSVVFTNNQVEANTIYNWSFGNAITSSAATTLTNLYTQAGCYDVSLTATNQYGCSENLTQGAAICFDPNPTASFDIQKNPLTVIDPTTLLQNTSLSANTSVWNFGDGAALSTEFSPIHSFPEKAGSYTVTLQIANSNGCKDSTTQIIQIEQDPIYYVPNAFTPDGSELNNVFLPIFSTSLVLESYMVQIFNRWGEVIFESQDPQKGWDGCVFTSKGNMMSPDGSYTYKMVFTEEGFEKVFEVLGSVVLLR